MCTSNVARASRWQVLFKVAELTRQSMKRIEEAIVAQVESGNMPRRQVRDSQAHAYTNNARNMFAYMLMTTVEFLRMADDPDVLDPRFLLPVTLSDVQGDMGSRCRPHRTS